jgi:hypothetical protein
MGGESDEATSHSTATASNTQQMHAWMDHGWEVVLVHAFPACVLLWLLHCIVVARPTRLLAK